MRSIIPQYQHRNNSGKFHNGTISGLCYTPATLPSVFDFGQKELFCMPKYLKSVLFSPLRSFTGGSIWVGGAYYSGFTFRLFCQTWMRSGLNVFLCSHLMQWCIGFTTHTLATDDTDLHCDNNLISHVFSQASQNIGFFGVFVGQAYCSYVSRFYTNSHATVPTLPRQVQYISSSLEWDSELINYWGAIFLRFFLTSYPISLNNMCTYTTTTLPYVGIFMSEVFLVGGLRILPRTELHHRTGIFNLVAARLLLTFQTKFCLLNRRMRKLSKNKVKYRRSFVYVRGSKRLVATGRFINYFTKFTPEFRYVDRISNLLSEVVKSPENSPLVSVREKQQALVLSKLLV